jgi:hypothetical protein
MCFRSLSNLYLGSAFVHEYVAIISDASTLSYSPRFSFVPDSSYLYCHQLSPFDLRMIYSTSARSLDTEQTVDKRDLLDLVHVLLC